VDLSEDVAQAWRGSKLRAWGVGVGIGAIGALVASGVGLFTGLCCLFQFANVLAPLFAGVIGGLFASLVGKWSDMPGIGGAGAGAFLGLRGGGLAALLTGLLGFAFATVWPLMTMAWSAYNSGGNVMETLLVSAAGVGFTALMAALFSGGGALVGLLLGVAAGAIGGAILGR